MFSHTKKKRGTRVTNKEWKEILEGDGVAGYSGPGCAKQLVLVVLAVLGPILSGEVRTLWKYSVPVGVSRVALWPASAHIPAGRRLCTRYYP